MNRSRTAVALGIVVVLLGVFGYGYRQYRDATQASDALGQAFVEAIRHPRPTALAPVDPVAWNQLRVGMSKEEVVHLFGESPCHTEYDQAPVGDPSKHEHIDFWEYGYASAFGSPVPDDRAHVVYFNLAGRVVSLRAPTLQRAADDSKSGR